MFEFLADDADERKKTVRTTLYEDQEFTLWELEILHTPIVQRLYDLKQLGFADRVFPDAVHSRFNHILGVAEVVERMAVRLEKWLSRKGSADLIYASNRFSPTDPKADRTITCAELATLLRGRRPSLRLMGLLHDITHAAFGHTLEDEVQVFTEKHDQPLRQIRFFNALVAQMFYIWSVEARIRMPDSATIGRLTQLSCDATEFQEWVEEVGERLPEEQRKSLADKLRELEIALRLLLRLEFVHHSDARPLPADEPLFVTEAVAILNPAMGALDLVLHRDAFLIDMVGNTICADLLDYGHRDAVNAGLKVQFDARLIRYLTVVSVKNELSPTHEPCLRLALQFFTDKMRHDVLSEMSGILKARYVINERVLFHPTKCAAGAVLGTAVQLLGLGELPGWIQVLGDQEFLSELARVATYLGAFCGTYEAGGDFVVGLNAFWASSPETARLLEQCVRGISGAPGNVLTDSQRDSILARVEAGRRLCWKLRARRLPKLAFRLRAGFHHSGGARGDDTIAAKYLQPTLRFELERKIEELCHLPLGSVVVHCPRRRTSMKLAEVLVVGADLARVSRLRDATEVSTEGLAPYQSEIRAIEDMYTSIWQFHVFIESSWFDKQPVVEWALRTELGYPNDQLLTQELAHEPQSPFGVLAKDLLPEVAPKLIPQVIAEMDSRMRYRLSPKDVRGWIRQIISSVSGPTQRTLPGTTPDRK